MIARMQAEPDAIVKVLPSERSQVFATLTSAFKDDPVERWLYPDDESYERHFPEFLEAFGGPAFDAATVWRVGDFDAVALWIPPGAEPDADAIGAVLAASLPPAVLAETLAVLEQMDAAHPREAHWYLPWLGVHHERQGQGLGDRLLRRCLEVVDESHQSVYLETPNPRTVPFYERHGFIVVGGTRSDTCPPITFLARARTA